MARGKIQKIQAYLFRSVAQAFRNSATWWTLLLIISLFAFTRLAPSDYRHIDSVVFYALKLDGAAVLLAGIMLYVRMRKWMRVAAPSPVWIRHMITFGFICFALGIAIFFTSVGVPVLDTTVIDAADAAFVVLGFILMMFGMTILMTRAT